MAADAGSGAAEALEAEMRPGGTESPPPNTGVDHRKLGMWTFIGSECMLFGSLIATFLIYRGRSVVGPYPEELLNIPFITVTTFVLLMSSLMMVLALDAVQRDDAKSKLWLFMTPFFGLLFLGGQYYEFSHFVHEGLTLDQNLFSSTFFVLTGTHGAHVAGGVLWLGTLWIRDLRGKLGSGDAITVEVAGLYWHFVDVVWIVLFTLIYLLE